MPDSHSTRRGNTATASNTRMKPDNTRLIDSHALDTPPERHPLQPFLPPNARLLMLGSFPPPQKRWSMFFYYPNFQNDMWRIIGLIFKKDKNAFVDEPSRAFKMPALISFLSEAGIALYDTACEVRRQQGNASDKYLEIIEPTDIGKLLKQLPHCHAIAVTGQKAADTACMTFGLKQQPKVGEHISFTLNGRRYELYRMPSTSRAYPMSIEKKSLAYAAMFNSIGILK